MAKRYINFIVVPEDESAGIKFRLSVLSVRLIVAILGVAILLVMAMTISYVRMLSVVVLADKLKQENKRLLEYNSRVVELEREVEKYRSFLKKVANLAGIDKDVSQREGQLGTGDKGQAESTIRYSIGPQQVDSQITDIPNGLPLGGWISKDFTREHRAIDIAAKEGTEVTATADGVVKFVGWDETFGNLIILKHKGDLESYYGHNQQILVKTNQKVRKGDAIALSGNTGRSTAPHLHYEIKKDDVAVNPRNYMGKK